MMQNLYWINFDISVLILLLMSCPGRCLSRKDKLLQGVGGKSLKNDFAPCTCAVLLPHKGLLKGLQTYTSSSNSLSIGASKTLGNVS